MLDVSAKTEKYAFKEMACYRFRARPNSLASPSFVVDLRQRAKRGEVGKFGLCVGVPLAIKLQIHSLPEE